MKTFYHFYFSSKTLVLIFCTLCFCVNSQAQQFVNLLVNPGMNESHDGWSFDTNGGVGSEIAIDLGIDGTGAIHTGYDTGVFQEIDLIAYGYSASLLDEAPIIRFSDWIKGSGTDMADSYRFEIILKDVDGGEIAKYVSHDDIGWITTTDTWQQITHNFIDYGPGLRSIYIKRQGWDAEFDQSSNVGVIMDAAYLSINNHFIYASGRTGDLSGWTIDEDGGDGWGNVNNQFRTSFGMCSKSQTVNLLELGYSEDKLDTQPEIDIWEFYFGYDGPQDGSGFSDTHFMKIELRDANGNVLDSFDSGMLTCTQDAQYVEANFRNYGKGLREVYIQHGGQDSEFWAGHYGGMVDATQMTLNFTTAIGIEEIIENNASMRLFPNNVQQSEQVNVHFENGLIGEFDLVLLDLSGKIIESIGVEKLNAQFYQTIETRALQSGIYFVQMQQKGFTATQKLVVQ